MLYLLKVNLFTSHRNTLPTLVSKKLNCVCICILEEPAFYIDINFNIDINVCNCKTQQLFLERVSCYDGSLMGSVVFIK